MVNEFDTKNKLKVCVCVCMYSTAYCSNKSIAVKIIVKRL